MDLHGRARALSRSTVSQWCAGVLDKANTVGPQRQSDRCERHERL